MIRSDLVQVQLAHQTQPCLTTIPQIRLSSTLVKVITVINHPSPQRGKTTCVFSWCRRPRWTFHTVLVSEVTYVSEERERMFQHVHVPLPMRMSFDSAVGHRSGSAGAREGDLAAHCSLRRPEPA